MIVRDPSLDAVEHAAGLGLVCAPHGPTTSVGNKIASGAGRLDPNRYEVY